MWKLPQLVQIQKARCAFRNGHLDEAFAIASRDDLKDYRQCQKLLEDLLDPLLARAREHLAAGRHEDALADIERAQRAGGNQPETASLREEALAALAHRNQAAHHGRHALDSVHRHLEEGRLDEGANRLAAARVASENREKAEELGRLLESRKRQAEEARSRIEACLRSGAVEDALRAAQSLQAMAAGQPETHAVLDQTVRQVEAEVADALTTAAIGRARRLLELAASLPVGADHLQPWVEALDLIDKAAAALDRGQWSDGRTYCTRLKSLLPSANWVIQNETLFATMEETLYQLRSGPVGASASNVKGNPAPPPHLSPTVHVPLPGEGECATAGIARPKPGNNTIGDRFTLWVEGVGTYLLLRSERITIGRAGSSATPDIALPADLEGAHAQILRVDHDYFLVPRGPAAVNGTATTRHLLADGDEILLGARGRMTFKLPTALSGTALLELGPGLRMPGDVRHVLLLDEHLIFGPPGQTHIRIPGLRDRIVLSAEREGFRCRAFTPVSIDGTLRSRNELLPAGSNVEAGPVAFTLTEGGTR